MTDEAGLKGGWVSASLEWAPQCLYNYAYVDVCNVAFAGVEETGVDSQTDFC